jgi:hypothetical protein
MGSYLEAPDEEAGKVWSCRCYEHGHFVGCRSSLFESSAMHANRYSSAGITAIVKTSKITAMLSSDFGMLLVSK